MKFIKVVRIGESTRQMRSYGRLQSGSITAPKSLKNMHLSELFGTFKFKQGQNLFGLSNTGPKDVPDVFRGHLVITD